jgi:hypothetical protein
MYVCTRWQQKKRSPQQQQHAQKYEEERKKEEKNNHVHLLHFPGLEFTFFEKSFFYEMIESRFRLRDWDTARTHSPSSVHSGHFPRKGGNGREEPDTVVPAAVELYSPDGPLFLQLQYGRIPEVLFLHKFVFASPVWSIIPQF